MRCKNSLLTGFFVLFLIGFLAVGHRASAADNVTYSGTIKNGNGLPVPGLSVILTDRTTAIDFVSELTDGEGAFTVSVPPGSYNLILKNINNDPSVPVFTRIRMPRLDISVNTYQDLVIPFKSVNITVLGATGQPAYALVSLRQTAANTNTFQLYPGSPSASVAGADWTSSGYTDRSGVASLTYFPSSNVFVNLTPNYGIVLDSLLRNFLDDSPQTINLSGVYSLSGVIRNGDGVTVQGMFIKLKNDATLETYSSLLTAADGEFRVSAPNGSYSLVVTNNDLVPQLPCFDDIVMPGFVVAGADAVQDLTVPARSITLTILSPYGEPAPGTAILVLSAENADPFALYPDGPQATITGNGWYSIAWSGDETGLASVSIFTGHDIDVTVNPDPMADKHFGVNTYTRDFLDFSPQTVNMAIMRSLSGVVRDGNGNPLPGMYIITYVNADILTYYSDITGSDGAYTVFQPSGTYTLSVKNRDLSPLIPVFDGIIMPGLVIPDEDVVQDLTVPSQTVTVTVLDSYANPLSAHIALKQNSPEEILPVVLYPGGPQASVANWRSTAYNDESGNANMVFFPSQNVLVKINPLGKKLDTVDYIRDFVDAAPQTIVFKTIFTLSGVIRDEAGNPLSGITVSLKTNRVVVATTAGPTGSDGAYSIEAPFGTYRLVMEDSATPKSNKSVITGVGLYSDTLMDLTFVPEITLKQPAL